MKKVYLFLTLFSFLWMMSCSDDDQVGNGFDPERDIVEDRGEAPGEEYVVEKDMKYVDVFYYVPYGSVALSDWHWRLSGITDHIQHFFAKNLKTYYNIDKKFEVVRNKINPKYIKIHLLQGLPIEGDLNDPEDTTAFNRGIAGIGKQLFTYWQENPEAKIGSHHFVFLPESFSNFAIKKYVSPDRTLDYIAFLPVDRETFNIKYFTYNGLRNRYLRGLSSVLYTTGSSFGIWDNLPNAQQSFMSLTQRYNYANVPDYVRLTEADALILDQCGAFNPRSQGVRYDEYPEHFSIRDVTMVAAGSKTVINCEFSSDVPVLRMFVFNDPWTAVDYYGEPSLEDDENRRLPDENSIIFSSNLLQETSSVNGVYIYQTKIEIPHSFIYNEFKKPLYPLEYGKSEFQFKFLLKNGLVHPEVDSVYYTDAEVHPDRFRYQYYWIPGVEADSYAAQLLTDVRQRNDEIYERRGWMTLPEIAEDVLDGDVATIWKSAVDDDEKPEIQILMPKVMTVDGIRIRTESKLSPLRVTVYVQVGEIEKLVVDNRLIPGDENMYKYIDFDRVVGVNRVKIRVEEGQGSEMEVGEIDVYKNLDRGN